MTKPPKKTAEIFAKNFYRHRREKNISAAEIAERVGVTRASISRYESIDEFAFPKPDTMDRIAEAMGIKVSELFMTEEKKSDPQNITLDDAIFVLNRHLTDAGLKISRLKKDF